MKKIIILFLCCILLTSCVHENNDTISPERMKKMPYSSVIPIVNQTENTEKNVYEPLNYDIQKAVWISYIDLASNLTGKTESEFRYKFQKMCKNVSELGCNTIYLHLRPFGDAIYNSEIYPASRYITGVAEKSADFDPLKIMLEIAHDYGLSVHGWINPLRCETKETIMNYSGDYLIKDWLNEGDGKICEVEGDEHLWLNPAFEEVRQLIAEGAKEIAENYDIDGIHFDDYFYPTTDESFDEQCYSEDCGKSLSEWRTENISLMIQKIYSEVKSVNSDILVGVSPQGNMENNYDYMYADVKTWCSGYGYIDYIVPQIYFGYENSVKPFEQTVEEWQNIITDDNIKLIVGLGVYKISDENESEFVENQGIIANQIEDSLDTFDCKGFALYNYINLFEPSEDSSVRANAEVECIKKALNS